MTDFEQIWLTAMGEMDCDGLPWVLDTAGAESSLDMAYQELWDARKHLCERFEIGWEDADLQRIVEAVACLEKDIGKRMFQCGILYAHRGCKL